MDVSMLRKDTLAKRIAGEIVLSPVPGKTIQKWRNVFKLPQRVLADHMGIMPSVISDYENGRRKSPGIGVIKKIVDNMIQLDERRGGVVIKEFSEFPTDSVLSEAVIDLKEFSSPVSVGDFCSALGAKLHARRDLSDTMIHGYTIIDAPKAIIELPPMELVKLYGLTNNRALVFVGTRSGKSSLVALKVTNLKPGLVVLESSVEIDDLTKRIAETESIPLAVVYKGERGDIVGRLKTLS